MIIPRPVKSHLSPGGRMVALSADAPSHGKPTTLELPAVEIEDASRYSWRGVHLDVARHFLRAAHPDVEFESCAGGGGRVGLGIMHRVDQVWTSDNTDAWDRVRIQHGFTQAYTPQAMMAWVTDSPNSLTGRWPVPSE